MCDGGQDYIDKQYSFIAHLSDVTITQMRKRQKERYSRRKEEKEKKDTQYSWGSTNTKLNLNEHRM